MAVNTYRTYFITLFLLITISYSTSVTGQRLDDSEEDIVADRDKNEIKEYVTSVELNNEITTATPERPAEPRAEAATKPPSISGTRTRDRSDSRSGSNSGSSSESSTGSSNSRNKIDAMDKYILDGILDIVDEKFSTLNNRLLTIERGMNDLQYYSIRSFRVVNTHLHAVDTILHSMQNQLTLNENQNLAIEQSVGSIKDDVADLQTMNNGVFQAIEQNLVHFHTDMQNRINEVKQGMEHMNFNVEQLRNETDGVKVNIDSIQQGQNDVGAKLDEIEKVNSELLLISNTALNVSLANHETSENAVYHTIKTRSAMDAVSQNMSIVARYTDEIRRGVSVVMSDLQNDNYGARKQFKDDNDKSYDNIPYSDPSEHMSCAKMLEILDDKLKHINVTMTRPNRKELKASKDCESGSVLDQEDFNNQTRHLMDALATVNENVYQSVTLYRHTGSLIERVLNDNEKIASDQTELREEVLSYLLNGTLELFNRSMPDFTDFIGSSDRKIMKSDDRFDSDKCSLTKQAIDDISSLSRNGTQLVELLSDLALSSSTTIRHSLEKLDQEVSSLSRLQENKLNEYLANKVEAFSRDEKNSQLKDIQNKTDLIYLFAEAIASNTGWIPFVYHRIMFVENQVNKTLSQISNIDTSVKEILLSQKANLAVILKPKKKDDLDNRITPVPETNKPDITQPFSASSFTTSGNQSNGSLAQFDSMMQFVHSTNQKINRLIPALTNLLGEPEPYISLVDGNSDREGRVEVYNKGQWGTIPGTFSHVEAAYVCRKLGFVGGIFAGNGVFGAGSGPFWDLNVTCLRTRWCNAVAEVRDRSMYSHATDVGVICDHMIRLTKTNEEEEQEVTRHSGKLEIYHQNSWLPVCYDGWGRDEPSVVCRQLGFFEGSASGVANDTLPDTRWMTNVQCSGSENRLDACAHDFKFNGCNSNEYVSMICS